MSTKNQKNTAQTQETKQTQEIAEQTVVETKVETKVETEVEETNVVAEAEKEILNPGTSALFRSAGGDEPAKKETFTGRGKLVMKIIDDFVAGASRNKAPDAAKLVTRDFAKCMLNMLMSLSGQELRDTVQYLFKQIKTHKDDAFAVGMYPRFLPHVLTNEELDKFVLFMRVMRVAALDREHLHERVDVDYVLSKLGNEKTAGQLRTILK